MSINPLLWQMSNTYRRYKTFRRYLQILWLLTKFQFRQLFRIGHSSNPGKGGGIRLLLEDLGPTFIKFGQILSTRTECPPEIRRELVKLQDRVPSFSYEEVEDIIEEEFAATVDELFSSFEKEPIAAASLAQVHQAVLRSGETVAVKVQRPNLESIITQDLAVLESVGNLIPKLLPRTRTFGIPIIMKKFGMTLMDEIDFVLEARNQDKIARNFKHDKKVKIPRVNWDYTSKRVITMEFIDGIKINEFDEIERRGLDRHKICKHFVDSMLKQIFVHELVHGDPHPANVFILPKNRICYLDFGMIEPVEKHVLRALSDIVLAVVHYESGTRLAEAVLSLHLGKREEVELDRLDSSMTSFITRHVVEGKIPLRQKGVGYILNELVFEVFPFGIKFDPSFILIIKSLLYVEMLAGNLDPGFDVLDVVKKYNERIVTKRKWKKIDPFYLRDPDKFAHKVVDYSFYITKRLSRRVHRRKKKRKKEGERVGESPQEVRHVLEEIQNHSSHSTLKGVMIGGLIAGLILLIVLRILGL